MAARKVSNAAAMAVAIAVVAMLLVAAAADDCNVNKEQVRNSCLSYCGGNGSKLNQCCSALKNADTPCLCRNYWSKLQNTPYAKCARDIQSNCGIRRC